MTMTTTTATFYTEHPAKLSTLPPELLARIFALLPNPKPISQTARWERNVTTSPSVQLGWARRFMAGYNHDWESVTNDAAVWGPPPSSHGFGDAGSGGAGTAVLATPGMLAACMAVCQLPVDKRNSAKIAARVFVAACAWDAIDVVRTLLQVWKGDDALTREMAEQGIQFAARSGALKVVVFLRDAGFGVAVGGGVVVGSGVEDEEENDVVGVWCAELQEALADWRAEGRTDVASMKRRHSVIEALLTSVRPDGSSVKTAAARLLCASIGDVGAMRICLKWRGVQVSAETDDAAAVYAATMDEMRNNMLPSAPATAAANEINAALTLCALLSDDSATVQAAARILPTAAIVQLLRHCVAPPAQSHMIAFLLNSIPRKHLPSQLRHLLELVLLTARADILEWITALLPLTDRTAYPGISAALTTAVLHTGGARRNPSHVTTVRNAIEIIAAAGADIPACGTTALIHAARLGDVWAVRWLVDHGVDARSRAGTVALTHANAGVNGAEVTSVLLTAGAIPISSAPRWP
ncbi:hypothetical protein HDU86_007883 [Geranomyces michiganensis]|nr:hypothetical protein HDU86_007883 [Geranomyces michiganensis]